MTHGGILPVVRYSCGAFAAHSFGDPAARLRPSTRGRLSRQCLRSRFPHRRGSNPCRIRESRRRMCEFTAPLENCSRAAAAYLWLFAKKQLKSAGALHRALSAASADLVMYLLQVPLDRALGHAEALGDFLVAQARIISVRISRSCSRLHQQAFVVGRICRCGTSGTDRRRLAEPAVRRRMHPSDVSIRWTRFLEQRAHDRALVDEASQAAHTHSTGLAPRATARCAASLLPLVKMDAGEQDVPADQREHGAASRTEASPLPSDRRRFE